MWFELKPVGLDFLENAPRITVVECGVDLPRQVVWDALVDEALLETASDPAPSSRAERFRRLRRLLGAQS